MGLLGSIGQSLGLTSDRSANPYRDVNQDNFNMPGYENRGNNLMGLAGGVQGRGAPQIGAYQTAGASDPFRSQQLGLAQQLGRLASGQDSYSAEQLRQAADANIGMQQGMMASNRANPAMAARMGMQNAGRINQGLAGQQSLAGIQERNTAAMGLGGLLAQGRGADEQLNMFNAGQQNQRTGMQAGMNQQQMGMNDQAGLGYLGLEQQNAALQQQGMMGYEQNRTNRFGQYMQTPTADEQMFGGLAGLGMGWMSMGGGNKGGGNG